MFLRGKNSRLKLTILDLVVWCENEKVPFVTFRDWSSITQTCKDIAEGKTTVKEAAKGRI